MRGPGLDEGGAQTGPCRTGAAAPWPATLPSGPLRNLTPWSENAAASRTHIVAPPDVAERVAAGPCAGRRRRCPPPTWPPCCGDNGTDPDASPPVRPCASETGSGPTASCTGRPCRSPSLFRSRLDPEPAPPCGRPARQHPRLRVRPVRRWALRRGAGGHQPHPARRAPGPRHHLHRRASCCITEPRHQDLLAPVLAGSTCRAECSCRAVSPTRRPAGARWASRWTTPWPRRRAVTTSGTRAAGARARRRHAVGPALHLGHVGRPQSGALHPTPPAHHREPHDHGPRTWGPTTSATWPCRCSIPTR